MPTAAPSPIRFAVFEVNLQARELRKRGIKIKLQDQPFEVLATLLERPGQVVTREQLKARIWADDTFVDFDLGLNKAVNRLREALGDTAVTPRFIETLPRRGYRFIAPIDGLQANQRQRLLRASLLPPQGHSFLPNHFAISPDGTCLAFVAVDSNRRETLWVRDLATPGAQQLAGSDGALAPFWRPDSRHIGFFAGGRLQTIDIAGGAVRVLCDARVAIGGAWHSDDILVFAGQVRGPLYRVSATGGTPVPVTPVPAADSSQLHCWPAFLPGTDRFLYFANRTSPEDAMSNGLYAGSLSSSDAHLVSAEIDGNVGFAAGHIFFVKDGGLHAQPFDVERLRLSGEPIPIAPHEIDILDRAFFRSGFSVSSTGMMIFQSRTDFARELVWTDASGNEQERIQGGYCDPQISPNGRFVVVSSDGYICVHDIVRGVTTRLTDGGHEWCPAWFPDGKRINYHSIEGHMSRTFEIAADGSGSPQLLVENFSVLASVSQEGAVVFSRFGRGSPQLAGRLPGSKETIGLGPGVEHRFSPDGKWIAFTEYGGAGIDVRPFPGPGHRLRISSGRGAQARWTHDGTQLFYIAPDKTLMAVRFDAETGAAGPPRALFQTRIAGAFLAGWQYDVAPDGRFLINSMPAGSPPLTLLAGCDSLLRKRRE